MVGTRGEGRGIKGEETMTKDTLFLRAKNSAILHNSKRESGEQQAFIQTRKDGRVVSIWLIAWRLGDQDWG